MEPFITVLIAIVVFAFQVYSNFKKEQEKARNRKMTPPPLPEDNARRRVEVPQEKGKEIVSQPVLRSEFEQYSGMMDVDEVKRVRGSRKPPQKVLRVEVEENVNRAAFIDADTFDLRDAVIKSVILERPYR